MNIVVCIKQVPNVAEIKFNSETRTIVREGVTLQLNSLDRRALTQAIRLREDHGGSVTVLTLGPPQAKRVLAEALATGADRAIHVVDPAFAGSDTLATARALAAAIKKLDHDLVFCGRFSIDAETGQVGPEVAEFLDIPHATNLSKVVEVHPSGRSLTVQREVEDGLETLEVQFPCLLTAGEFLVTPIRPTPEEIQAALERPIEAWDAAAIGLPSDQTGIAGSPTSVSQIHELVIPREKRVIAGDDPESAAQQLLDYLVQRGLFTGWERATAQVPAGDGPKAALQSDRAVWVVAEQTQGQLRNITLELLGKGAELAHQLHSELAVLLLGSGVAAQADTLAAYGAQRVYLADHPSLAHYDHAGYAKVVADAITSLRPYIVLLGSTVNGRDLAPRVAARLGLGLTGDCIGLEIDDQGRLVQLKPAFGGNIVAPILSRTTPAMATVRPGVIAKLAPQNGTSAAVERLEVTPPDSRVRLVDFQTIAGSDGVNLDDAEAIVGVGAGIGGEDNLPLLKEMAEAFGATLGTTLKAVNTKILPSQLQIGLTGRAVAPRFYVAVAIHGALNHMIGIQKAETIVAINNNPEAPIFDNCDFGIVGDFTQIVPAVTRMAREAREKTGAAVAL